jgi:hypothetical protein
MATNLAGGVCIGQLNACVLRAARLNANCAPTGGTNGGIVTAALITMTADPDIDDGAVFEPVNACGTILYTYEEEAKIKRYNLSGEMGFFDWEAMALLFGGTNVLGRAAGSYSGKVIGYADKLYSATPGNGVYLEVIVQNVIQGAGACVSPNASTPVATGYIFGKVKLTPGSSNFEHAEKRMTFSGKATNNPNLYNGPWNDYPGTGYIPSSAMVQVGYSQTEYDAIVATIGCGYKDLPAGS